MSNSINNKKTALILGIFGQDGSYLAEFLLAKGYKVFGFSRSRPKGGVDYLDKLAEKIVFIKGDLKSKKDIELAIKISKPDEIYNLAGITDLAAAKKYPKMTMNANYRAVGYLVKKALEVNPKVKIFQAGSAQMFCDSKKPVKEKSTMCSRNSYAEAKIKAHREFIESYRRKHSLFACSGFLFNHESPRRDKRFVTKKIIDGLAEIKRTGRGVLELGNLDAKKDWGFAGDYVKAIWLMLQQKRPNDYIIATGKLHTVKKFVEIVAGALDIKLRWRGRGVKEAGLDQSGRTIIKVNPKYYRKNEPVMRADTSKINKKFDWRPRTSFKKLVEMMVKEKSNQ